MKTPKRISRIGSRNRASIGSAYVMVLVVSMIVTAIGVSAITLTRVQTRATVTANDWAEAQILAFSAAEHAMSIVNAGDDWRKLYTHGAVAVDQVIGNGSYSITFHDTLDLDFTDIATDPLSILATGTVGKATYKLTMEVNPTLNSSATITQGSWTRDVD